MEPFVVCFFIGLVAASGVFHRFGRDWIAAAMVFLVILCCSFGWRAYATRQWLAGYEIWKQTIESGIREGVNSPEWLRLIYEASRLNRELDRRTAEAQQWYGYADTRDIFRTQRINVRGR